MVLSNFEYENNFVTTTREKINGIPCLKLRPKDSTGLLPTVFYYHGGNSSKDLKKFNAFVIAVNGYQVILPDALYHGERVPIGMDGNDPENHKKYLWEIVLQNIKESKTLIQEAINNHNADPSRIGIIGESMGAISASGIIIENPNLKCFVGFIGTYAWQESIKNKQLPPANDDNKTLIEFYDPINNGNKIKDRDILIINNIDDTIFSIDTQKLFYNKMLPLYKDNPNNFEFIEEPDVNHRITTRMLQRAIMWFKEHL